MTSGAKARALWQTSRMPALPSDRREIDLGMAPQTKIIVPRHEHFLINRAMHLMAGGATLAHRFMIPRKRPALIFVALEAGFVDVFERGGTPGLYLFAVWAVTVRTAHFPFENRMMIRHAELDFFIGVAGKTGRRIFSGI